MGPPAPAPRCARRSWRESWRAPSATTSERGGAASWWMCSGSARCSHRPSKRGRGHAAALIDAMVTDAAARGCAMALLFSEIGARYYEALGFQVVPREMVTVEVMPFTGSPAMLVRSGEAADLDAIAEISARYADGATFALERTPELIAFGLARKRLLAGLGRLRAARGRVFRRRGGRIGRPPMSSSRAGRTAGNSKSAAIAIRAARASARCCRC